MLDLGLSILDLGLWLGGMPAPVRVSASLDAAGKERAVEQSGSAFVVCENGMSLFVDVTWHHLGEGERFGVGLRGSKGTAAINPLTVWKELHGMPVDVSPTGSGSRENAFTASYRAEWAHFEAAIAGEAKVAVAAGAPDASQDPRRRLQVGGRWQGRHLVKAETAEEAEPTEGAEKGRGRREVARRHYFGVWRAVRLCGRSVWDSGRHRRPPASGPLHRLRPLRPRTPLPSSRCSS